jgi:formylglycine-generating enzyme required for sulfatase activity
VKRLNAMEKTRSYRLPGEAEWEYAARVGGPAVVIGVGFGVVWDVP